MRRIERALAVAGALGLGWMAWTYLRLKVERAHAARDQYERQMYR